MTDPSVEAAQRVICLQVSSAHQDDLVAAAREALKPVWEVIERYENLLNPWDDVGFEILNALRPLVYPPRS